MFPFYELVIAPTLRAVDAQRVVEIGALRGENTRQLFDALGPEAVLHVIDPVPDFDPVEHEREFPGRYVFHQDLSLNVLLGLEPMDVALIDGDHNWYTVYNEMKQLAAVARGADELLPVMLLHDVCWPYGRRDLYYGPDTIPDEFRQPWAQRGIKRDSSDLALGGGLNPTMNNALHEGGPRNGVLTGVDDFVAEYDRPLRTLLLPIYFGLSIVVEEARLERQPALAALLDHLENADGRGELLLLAEDTRLRAMMFQHNTFYRQESVVENATSRYLDLLKGALLNEHYLENEVRIDHLLDCLERSSQPVDDMMRDPTRNLKDKTRRMRALTKAGRITDESVDFPAYFPWTAMGRTRLDHLESTLDDLRTSDVEGDLVECGVGRGGGAIFLRGYADIHQWRKRIVWAADRFLASDPEGNRLDELPDGGRGFPHLLADLNVVRDGFARFHLLDEQVKFLLGHYDSTLDGGGPEKVALLRIGPGAARDSVTILEHLYPRIPKGGRVIIDGYADSAVRTQVDEFLARRNSPPIHQVDSVCVSWTKGEVDGPEIEVAASADDSSVIDRAPLIAERVRPGARKDLSVVAVFYNMDREAARTLHSLTRSYQEGIADLDYEVIVIDNGSDPAHRLDRKWVRSFGPEFRFVDMGDEAKPSPVPALNVGIQAGFGDNFALMIDGAHVLSPGVLRHGMAGLSTYEPAIVLTQQWYLGPGQQGEAMFDGYDQDYEDRLFKEIEWPTEGYRLFDIAHFIGNRDWLDGLWESNCIFVPRALLAQVGAFDESFSVAGGGYANLELYERLGSDPDTTVSTILGEGSFHQVHGGTTTNQPSISTRSGRIGSYAEDYAAIRGRNFSGPEKRMHYVGHMFWEACRTRPRRRVAPNFFSRGAPGDPDGEAIDPVPIPQDLRRDYTEAYWRNLRWQETSWLGRTVGRPPSDLFVYQEILSSVRPDFVIETGSGTGGRAVFLATIFELLGHGKVISIDPKERDRLAHPRITYIAGKGHEADTVDQVAEIVGGGSAVVILGTRGRRLRHVKEFEALERFVPLNSYVIVEDTIVNGHPVWSSFGMGPAEAVRELLNRHRNFASDSEMEKYSLTFCPGGFLKRVR